MRDTLAGEGPPFRLCLGDLADDAAPVGDEEREALRLMADAARAEPNDPDYYHILGEALLRAGKVKEAMKVCREAVDRDPLSAEYRFALGCALWRSGETARAERAFREAVPRQAEDPRSLNALGAALARLHREPEAISTFEKALKIDPQSAEIHANLGVALWGGGDQPGALRSFTRALRTDPERPEHHLNPALAQRAHGRASEAANVLTNMIRRWPDQADLYLELAEAFHEAGRSAEATRALDEAQRLDPAAIAQRPRSREIRDALRLHGVRKEARSERGPGRRGASRLSDALLGVLDLAGGLRPRVQVLSAVALLLTLAFGWFAWQVAPHYVRHYLLEDDVAVVARAPVRDDPIVRDRLRHAVQSRGLEEHIDVERCQVTSRPGWRRITCDYGVRAHLLPGLRRNLPFRLDVEQPYLVDPEPIVF